MLKPLVILGLSSAYAVVTATKLILTLDVKTLTSPRAFQYAWFATFWTALGPVFYASSESATARVLGAAYGRVLDLGYASPLPHEPPALCGLIAIKSGLGPHGGAA